MANAISVAVNNQAALASLSRLERRTAYVQVNAVNRTIKRIQAAERAHVESTLTVRRRDFISRQAAIIKPFASVPESRFWAKVSIGQKPRLLLGLLETGGRREPVKGRRVAVPLTTGPARPSFRSQVIESLTFRALHLTRRAAASVKGRLAGPRKRSRRRLAGAAPATPAEAPRKAQLRGAQRTFVVEQSDRLPEGGVFQRTGPERGDVRLVYPFVPPPRLEPLIRFIKTARETTDRWFGRDLQDEVRAAAQHALRG